MGGSQPRAPGDTGKGEGWIAMRFIREYSDYKSTSKYSHRSIVSSSIPQSFLIVRESPQFYMQVSVIAVRRDLDEWDG